MKNIFDSSESNGRRKSEPRIHRSSLIGANGSNATPRRMPRQISFNLDSLHESDPQISDRSGTHSAARQRRLWLEKLKKSFRRKKRRNSDPMMSGSFSRSSIGNDSDATDRVGHRRSIKKEISFRLDGLENDDSKQSSFTRKISYKLQNLIRGKKRRSFNKQNSIRYRRRSNGSISIKSSEFSNSEGVEDFDLSFNIMPRQSMRNIMSQRNLDPNLLDDMDEMDKVGLLAESRTPSFNVMLHANEIYSDTCTILKRQTVRISWTDLANNTNTPIVDEPEDFVRDIGGRKIDDMRFESFTSTEDTGEIFGLRRLRPRGSMLVRMPSEGRAGSNRGGVPLWSGTKSISFNKNFDSFVLHERTKDWLKALKTCDPRHQILTFFNNVAQEGATMEVDFELKDISPLLKYLYRSSVFTVWRPTSLEAIRRMMLGEAVGKGLDIKGKSAKRGKLSAFVPFLQIFEEEDKRKVRVLQKDSKIRIFFNSQRNRNVVMKNLNDLAIELAETVRAAKKILNDKDKESKYSEEIIENALEKMTLDMGDSTIDTIDTYAASKKYGIEVQERLFWEGMVMRQNIYRKPGSEDDIGRTSMASFQDMNCASLREPQSSVAGGHTRAVIMQYIPAGEDNNPMTPLNLVMAYEENDPANNRCRVIPVVSDFDCFIVGTRGVKYNEEVPEDQIKDLKWMMQQTDRILDRPKNESWTKRWLDILKEAGSSDFYPKVPDGGYSDPKTRFIFDHAIDRLGATGAVRHGAECYNYYFPQELDEDFLVISDELPLKYNRCNWTYVKQDELKEILKFKIEKGYTFPLNPKWILCDPGWKEVYDKLRLSDAMNVQDSLKCFYPPHSGITEMIEEICTKYPMGFERVKDAEAEQREMAGRSRISGRYSQIDGTAAMDLATIGLCNSSAEIEGTMAMDLAEQELKYHFVLQRAKKRMRGYLKMNSLLKTIRSNSENSISEEKDSFSIDEEKQNGRSDSVSLEDKELVESVAEHDIAPEESKSGTNENKIVEEQSEEDVVKSNPRTASMRTASMQRIESME